MKWIFGLFLFTSTYLKAQGNYTAIHKDNWLHVYYINNCDSTLVYEGFNYEAACNHYQYTLIDNRLFTACYTHMADLTINYNLSYTIFMGDSSSTYNKVYQVDYYEFNEPMPPIIIKGDSIKIPEKGINVSLRQDFKGINAQLVRYPILIEF